MLPDTRFHPGSLKYIVPDNEGRLLDSRRTPVRVLDVKRESGFFVVEILDFEDKGAHWEMPFESVDRFQFAQGSTEASLADIELYAEIISRLDHPLNIHADPSRRRSSEVKITSLRKNVKIWLDIKSEFLKSGARLDFLSRIGDPTLWRDLERYIKAEDLWDIEEAFADQYVSNPNSGELVKGHSIVLAELGFVSFEGKRVRNPNLFTGRWSKQRRADHILYRLAFVRELFEQIGQASVILYRGLSYERQPRARRSGSFISSTFNLDVAMSHFTSRDPSSTGVLLRQSVPIERIFMSFLETAQMNQRYKEAEAVLLYDSENNVF
jgi:hypothetical protein